MPLSWNEIRDRAILFSKEWENETNEDAEAKSFWDGFFNVFGIPRRRVATFEERVKKLDDKTGYVDLLWKGHILVEHKSKGKDLEKAYKQATEYFEGLKDKELPKYILVSDFARFRLYDLEEHTQHDFSLKDFYKNVKLFSFIAGYTQKSYKEEDAVNIEAAEMMGLLHDKLKAIGYDGHALEVYLVRLLFCLFADDTTIFQKGLFEDFIEFRTSEDGSDLAARLAQLFEVLNTPDERRLRNLDESLIQFPYVNGKLFEEVLPMASFDREMRKIILDCCLLNWGQISPAIFGSLFQSVMNPEQRRNLGAHYTSEKNIIKLIKPLFLDGLWMEFERVKGNKSKLVELHNKIANLKFLDAACGCGNFLIITYRELRSLEIEIIKALQKGQYATNLEALVKVDIDQFYGIEYEEFPSQIAQVAMWLIDHQMNQTISEIFGEYYARLPLRKSATIIQGNALRVDWEMLIPKSELSYILGNPPFLGKQYQTDSQKEDMELVFNGVDSYGILDYVCAWYIKAAQYIQGTKIVVGLVSTNSIAQGEQVHVLWSTLFKKYGIKIHFAHRTFKWNNEAKGNANVFVVIIGFANFDVADKFIYEYETVSSDPHEIKVKNINPYLVEGSDFTISPRSKPLCNVPNIVFGNMPNDGGYLILSEEEKDELISKDKRSKKYIRKFLGSYEFINNVPRYCLWLKDVSPKEISEIKDIEKRIEKVKAYRLESNREATRKLANFPSLFGEIRQPNGTYLIIPKVSSERRSYIPIGFMDRNTICSDLCLMVPNATLFHFGVITSKMHMTWVKYVCGRLKSDFRYSNKLVYNNFPFPESPTDKVLKTIEEKADKILKIRESYSDSSLAELYDPITMPPDLVKAHLELDKVVDLAYRKQPFPNEPKRLEFLFELYEKYNSPLIPLSKKIKRNS